MRVLFVSEYDAARGSGYTSIAAGLIAELERREWDVTMLAYDYRGEQHPHKAAVIPTDAHQFTKQVQAAKIAVAPDVILMCYDLTAIAAFGWLSRLGLPVVAIFPVESDPVVHPSEWTQAIDVLDGALCESRFGTKLLQDAGLRVTYFPVGIDLDHWRRPSPEEREKARADWGVADRFVVLTVCDNHERKNLPAMLAAFALATGKQIEWPPESGLTKSLGHTIDNGYFIINTKRRPAKIGYDVSALAEQFGVANDTLILQHELRGGIDAEGLRSLYWAADAVLSLSKAEGLGLTVLEGMACGVPVIGTDCTGIGESLADGRGFPVPVEYTTIDPFGNQYRRYADVVVAADALVEITRCAHLQVIEAAAAYVGAMTWAAAGEVLEAALTAAIERRKV